VTIHLYVHIDALLSALHVAGGVFILGYFDRVAAMRSKLLDAAAAAGLAWTEVKPLQGLTSILLCNDAIVMYFVQMCCHQQQQVL
jgi:hypothetical protein